MISSRNRRQIVLDNDPIIPIVGHANDAIQLGLFTGIFSALKEAMTGPARWFVLPATLVTEMMRGVLALVNYFNAVNRNFSKTSKAILETVKFLVIGLALLASLIGIVSIVAIAPLLFVAALGTNTLYHTVKSLFHAYKLYKETGEEGKKYHAKELNHSLIAAATGIISGLAITFLLIVSLPVTIITSIAAYTAAAVSGLSALWSGYEAIVSYRNRNVNKTIEKVEGLEVPLAADVAIANTPASVVRTHPILVHSSAQARPRLSAYHDDLIKDVLNSVRPQQDLSDLLRMKIDALNKQLEVQSFFQTTKRLEKLKFLENLLSLVNGEPVTISENEVLRTISTPAELLKHIKFRGQLNNVFNSFCSEVGEVQKLFLVADGLFERVRTGNAFLLKTVPDDLLRTTPTLS
jgi:hypothetical protein